MSYVFCLPYNRNAITPTPINPADPSMIPNTFHAYYLNKNVDAVGDGLTIATPFKAFDDYSAFAGRTSLTGKVVLNIDDADFYGSVSFLTASPGTEELYINAPFAAFKDMSIDRQNSMVTAGSISGNIKLGINSWLQVLDDVGTARAGLLDDSNPEVGSTELTFETKSTSLGNVVVYLQKDFNGSIDFSGITVSSSVNIYINRWVASNNDFQQKLKAALKTLPASTDTFKVQLKGQIQGLTFPRLLPTFTFKSGLPTKVQVNAGLYRPFNVVLHCTDSFNIESITACRFYRISYEGTVGTNERSADTVPTNVDSSAVREVSFDITFNAASLAGITSATSGVLFMEMDVVLRYFDGNSDVPHTNVLIHQIEHSN